MSPLPHPTVPGLRATWKALTIVFPQANVSGSTSVLCLLSVFVRLSTLILTRAVWALAGYDKPSEMVHASRATEKRGSRLLPREVFKCVDFIRISFMRGCLFA